MTYRIIGADGKTYGPVGPEEIRQWIALGRADHRTPVHVAGAPSWTYLGRLPEFAAEFPGQPPTPGAIRAGAPVARGTNGFATAGLTCAILSWTCCCCCGMPFSLLGLIFSLVALAQIRSQGEPREGHGLAIAGLVLSSANLLFSVAMPFLQLAINPAATGWPFHFQ